MAVIGIDLGTTNSLAAIWRNGKSEIIPNSLGKNLTPSVVSVDEDGTVYVGEAAKERLIVAPDMTASCFKRTMGQHYFYNLGKRTFSSTELSALVLQNLKRDAEKFLGEPVTEAVISVPAYFNQNQRKATKEAAELIGLKVERLVSEPTAAALCYGIQNMDDMSTAMVFDLGGGTFDISLLEFFEGVIDVKAVSGDNRLGGEDFTRAIAAWFIATNNLSGQTTKNEMSMIIKESEIAKRTITAETDMMMEAEIKVEVGGKTYSSVLTYDIFRSITEDLVERLKAPIFKVLHDQEKELEDIDAIILMGGSTRMNIVKNFVQELTDDVIISSYNPDETVALGAATLAAMKDKNEELKETVLTDICPFTLGTDVAVDTKDRFGGLSNTIFSPLIERNSPVPISVVKRYSAVMVGQTSVKIDVYQGESLDLKENLKLGEIDIDLPFNAEEREDVDVRFTYDINGLLEVEVTVVSTGKKKSIMLNNNQNFSEEELQKAREKMESLKVLPWEQEENILILERGKRLYAESLGEKRERIAYLISLFNKALASQNPKEIKKAAKAISEHFDALEQW